MALELTPADQLLILASDGVWEFISSKEAVDIVGGAASPEEGCRAVSLLGGGRGGMGCMWQGDPDHAGGLPSEDRLAAGRTPFYCHALDALQHRLPTTRFCLSHLAGLSCWWVPLVPLPFMGLPPDTRPCCWSPLPLAPPTHLPQLVEEAHRRWLSEEDGVVDDITAVVIKLIHSEAEGQ